MQGRQGAISIHLLACSLAAMSLWGCSRTQSAGREQLRSEIRSARSLAAESEMFIDVVLHGQATRRFAEGHAAYLEREVEQSAKEIGTAASKAGAAHAVGACRTELILLAHELSIIRAGIRDPEALAASKTRIRSIRARLEQLNSSL